MQEESGEAVCNDSNGLAEWLCPLCQLGQEDRGSLSLHLTEKHSVLPTCVDKLLNIAAPTELASGKKRPTASQITDAELLQLKQVQASDAPSNLPQHDVNADPTQKSDANMMEEKPELIGGQGNVSLNSQSVDSLPPDQSKTENDNGVAKTGSQPFRCNACLDTFPTKTALSVHYNSLSHVQRMKTGSSNPDGEINSGPSVPVLSRPYISNKPYQCAVCRVSYNHAITLESHMKSVLHQTRSRNAGNAGNFAPGNTGSNSAVVTPGGRATHFSTTTNCVGQGNLMISKDSELIQTTLAPSLLSSPVASAQAVSAFLTLLTSSPSSLSHSLLPSIFAPGATPGAATTQLMTQPQMLMPLILNGLQALSQGLPLENIGHLLTQAVPLQGLNAAQQAILAQKICRLQNQWPTVGISQTSPEVGKQYIKCKEDCGKEECAPVEENRLLKIEAEDSLDMEICDFKKEKAEEKGHTEHYPKAESQRNRVERELSMLEADIELSARDSSANKLDGDQVKDKIAQLQISLSPIVKCLHYDNGSPCGSIPSTSSLSPINWNLTLSPDSTPKKSQSGTSSSASVETPQGCSFKKPSISPDKSHSFSNIKGRQISLGPSVLSEFQSEVLWAFFESRSEADAASPPHEDCEALGREVGLTEKEVRKWLSEARNMKERQRATDREYRKGSAGYSSGGFKNYNSEECSLVIAEGDDRFVAIDLSSSKKRRRRERDMGKDSQADYCLTSDSDNEEVYTSVIVSDEDSQHASMKEGSDSPTKEDLQREMACGGKVLRSTTVFLSEAEDEDDEEGSEGQRSKRKRRKGELAREETEIKLERQDPDVDLELDAQADPAPLPHTLDHTGLHSGFLHSLPLSLSLAPLSQFIRPYVLSLPHSVVGVGVAEGDGGKTPAFPSPPNVTRFSDPLTTHSLSPHNETSCYMSNSGGCESALDLSIGKSNSSKASSSTYAMGDKTAVQKGRLLDGLGLRPTAKGLIVVQVKPEPTAPTSNSFTNCNSLTKTSAIYMRASEKINATLLEKEQELEREREQKRPKGKRYRDMRRSRTIIQAEQLDILYGCYFKDPNPGKHEFEQISEWVHLPKKVVQIWFQNMRARERKGEVRFISDGTLAAVGKPLIKFTWPLSKPIFSSVPKSGTNSGSVSALPVRTLLKSVKSKSDDKEVVKGTSQLVIKPKEAIATFSSGNSSTTAVPKTKLKTTSNITMVKIAPKTATSHLPTAPKESLSTGRLPLKQEVGDEDKTDEEVEEKGSTPGPGVPNRMVPKLPSTAIAKPPVSTMISQKQNGVNCWSAKSPFKINTLSREQLGLSTPMPHTTTTTSATPASTSTTTPISTTATSAQPNTPVKVATPMTKSNPTEGSFLHHSSSRRPRTHLSCLQLSILQSCYETCAHPNAMECEAIGTELGLPLKVVQIWFQNTRAKEKRWRLQQEKLSPLSSEKVDVSSGSYLQYNALRANRPILPKPVQLTVLEPALPPIAGQQATKETLRGRCDVCDTTFESRAAARSHVFSGRHLATLRSTNFGQPATLVSKGSGSGSSSVTGPSGEGVESSPTSTSNAS